MNYATIKSHDIANGPGVRVSLFVSGCPHHCPGCFNEETWDYQYGILYTKETEEEIITALSPTYIKGFSLLGGEPFVPEHQAVLLPLLQRIKETLPQKTIWAYSGYTWETLPDKQLLPYVDVLVDGPFIEAKKDLNLRFRGSGNQRLIDVQKSMKQGKIVLWSDPNTEEEQQ
ncbi:MAG: anaerobic ribonucleoside-triphosphate reductase activating protein [Ruminococcaceae bacterium]|nr:anaerobic ribonucleoside-triphosphate reductase activating protein [Oscillospiraceae bacterium]